MKNIIFLDIDGVLDNINASFNEESVNAVKKIIQIYNAKVVMITSWQMNGTKNRRNWLQHQLEELGIYNIDFIDPNFEGNFQNINIPSRLLGIIDYLKNYEVSSYVILDDDYHNEYKLLCLNHYRTMPLEGLKCSDLEKIRLKKVNLNNFKYVTYKYRKLGEYIKNNNDTTMNEVNINASIDSIVGLFINECPREDFLLQMIYVVKKCLDTITNIDYPIYSYNLKEGKINKIELTDELEQQIIQNLKSTQLFYWPDEYDKPVIDDISQTYKHAK